MWQEQRKKLCLTRIIYGLGAPCTLPVYEDKVVDLKSILEAFSDPFGGPERVWKKMPYKGGGNLLVALVFAN